MLISTGMCLYISEHVHPCLVGLLQSNIIVQFQISNVYLTINLPQVSELLQSICNVQTFYYVLFRVSCFHEIRREA